MATTIFDRIQAMASACMKHLTRTSRRLCGRTSSKFSAISRHASINVPFIGSKKKKKKKKSISSEKEETYNSESEVEEDGVWRRSILMGGKCQPLDFSGAIYYDVDGRRLAEIPAPRSPLPNPAIARYNAGN